MNIFNRMRRIARAVFAGSGGLSNVGAAELWCRPATVLALRDRARAPVCLAGWR
jgi:hypothetical protein